jgi:hypothetical protein
MNSTKSGGRPRRGTTSISKLIVRALVSNHGRATWRELKNELAKSSHGNDSSLKKGLDHLIEDHMIIPTATIRDGKAVMLYKLMRGPEARNEFYSEMYPLFEWITDTEQALSVEKWIGSEEDKQEHKSKQSMHLNIHPPVPDIQIKKQGLALAKALHGLTVEILDMIEISYDKTLNKTERERVYFLESAWDQYLSIIAMEISNLALPEYGDTHRAIQIARDNILDPKLAYSKKGKDNENH